MPFIGQDWRSPGEAWVKTETLGWQRMKTIESQLYTSCQQSLNCSWPPRSEFGQRMAENCHVRHERSGSVLRNSSLGSSDGTQSSDASSRTSSSSPSPISSPEKNVHQIYPITISSPYGLYNCCSHHLEHNGRGLLGCKCFNDNRNDKSDNRAMDAHKSALMQPSLSCESLTIDETNASRDETDRDFSELSSKIYMSRSMQNLSSDENNLSQVSSGDKQACSSTNCRQSCNPVVAMKFGELEQQNKCDTRPQDLPYNVCCHSKFHNLNQSHRHYNATAPHCRVSVRTREVAIYNTISEAFYRLDFCNAIHDIRRFNYICKLLHLLITQNLTSLSGCATKVLFTMLEQVAWEVSSNKRNIHVLKNLLNELRLMIQKYYCWGRPIGSSLLWQQHFDTIERISQMVDSIELAPSNNDKHQSGFNNLPVEMIREILLRLNDYRDLLNSAQASPIMRTMIDGQYLWQKLCRYHFSEQQLKLALDDYKTAQPSSASRRNNARGFKYARTSSADGKTSFRSPVAFSNKVKTSREKTPPTIPDENCRSQVTRAVRLFDGQGSTMKLDSATTSKSQSTKRDRPLICESKQANNSSDLMQKVGPNDTRPSNEIIGNQKSGHITTRPSSDPSIRRSADGIDWEHVFHQLRKKYDLKEEYPDCLLLCRHCRCLFWKSFGHPCIKSDDTLTTASRHCPSCLSNIKNQHTSDDSSPRYCDRSEHEQVRSSSSNRLQQAHNSGQLDADINGDLARPSVAALSRSFDNRALRSNPDAQGSGNLSPSNNVLAVGGRRTLGDRRPLGAINENANDVQSLARGSQREAHVNNGLLRHVQRRLPARQAAVHQENELVPKHVAISPQAFLKFFSL